MNVLFIYSVRETVHRDQPADKAIPAWEYIQSGISYISAVLKENGHRTDLFVLCARSKMEKLKECIDSFGPGLICFTSVFSEYEYISETASFIKSCYPDKYLLLGGVHASLNPEEAMKGDFDAVCIGEGEYAVLELACKLEKKEKVSVIKNLWVKTDGGIERNPTNDFIGDLDSLPFADRDMWEKWVCVPDSQPSVLLGRGCPFQCTYCCNHALRQLAGGSYVRFRSPENIVEEIKQIVEKNAAVRSIYLEVETVGVKMGFALDLCSKLEQFNGQRQEALSFGVNLRITPGKDFSELFAAMKRANFSYIKIGLESGSERIRKEVLRRNYSNSDYYRAVEQAKGYGFEVFVYVMIGLPGERLLDFKETVECVRRSQPKQPAYSIFFPYPGTHLYDYCQEHNLLPRKINKSRERRRAVLDLDGFSRGQIQRQFDLFYYNVYKGHRSLREIWQMTKYKKLDSCYALNYLTIKHWVRFYHRVKRKFIKGGLFRGRLK